MGLFGDALGLAKDVGDSVVSDGVHLAEDGYRLATDSHYREQAWNSAVSDAKAAANSAASAVRTADAAKEQLGSGIDSGEKYLEKKIDEGRSWLRENGGAVGQATSDDIGLVEGGAVSVYDAGKGLVQLENGVQSLTSPMEWLANPSANVARVKSVVNSAETLGRIGNLTQPASWIADPQGNAQLTGALWHGAATGFKNDPAKFVGNAIGTIGTLFIPGADGAGAVNDAARVTELAMDGGKAATITGEASKAAAIAQDAGRVAGVSEDAGGAASAASRRE